MTSPSVWPNSIGTRRPLRNLDLMVSKTVGAVETIDDCIPQAEEFVAGYVSGRPKKTHAELKRAIEERFGIAVSVSAVSRCLGRLGLKQETTKAQRNVPELSHVPDAGFELIIASDTRKQTCHSETK